MVQPGSPAFAPIFAAAPARPRGADAGDTAVTQALAHLAGPLARWHEHAFAGASGSTSPSERWLMGVPDVGPACEVLLADRLLHDLDPTEQAGLQAWVRAHQDGSGAWLDAQGNPDLSLTVLGYWALAQSGDRRDSEPMIKAVRVVHALGGAQRANFGVRLWLAMAGHIGWNWLPALPSEMFLLSPRLPLSPARFSPWARSILTAYHLIARAPARLHLADASELLLRKSGESLVAPRLTRVGLAGDLLQAFDRTVKLSRKLPRGPLPERAQARAQRWIDETQQDHGGWFSVRPTLFSLVALRVMGAQSDDPRIRRGLDYLRRARGQARVQRGLGAGQVTLAQGLGLPLALTAAALGPVPDPAHVPWLLRQELCGPGPWQRRADVPPGGWPVEPGANAHLDLEATCAVLELLAALPHRDLSASATWATARRAGDVLLAMQQPDGSFARFERGEADVPMRRLPWSDADLLAYGQPNDAEHLRLTGLALARLAGLGLRADDDRIARGLAYCQGALAAQHGPVELSTLWALSQALGPLLPPEHALRRDLERRVRTRQGEDGRFGDLVDTALALRSLLALGPVCVQAQRAARVLTDAAMAGHPDLDYAQSRVALGFGLSNHLVDPSAGVRQTVAALTTFAARQAEHSKAHRRVELPS